MPTSIASLPTPRPAQPPTHDGPALPDPGRVALEYADRMFARQTRPLPPAGFTVDWGDQPLRHLLFPGRTRRPLPRTLGPGAASLGQVLAAAGGPPDLPSLEILAAVLAGNTLTDRRLTVDWNDDTLRRAAATAAAWSRPTPSGGGMYPVETYLVGDGTGGLPRGVHHYDTTHHALVELATGDRTGEVAAASGGRAGAYLIATIRFWKNAFKYNSFCYHVVCQDAGALLATWRLTLGAHGIGTRPRLWFNQGLVSDALGLDPRAEHPVLLLPLGPDRPSSASDDGSAPDVSGRTRLIPRPSSARPRTFPLVELVGAATHAAGALPHVDPQAVAIRPVLASAEERIVLPPVAEDGEPPVAAALMARRSSFGRLIATPSLSAAELGSVLAATAGATRLPTSPTTPESAANPARVRIWVVAAAVSDVPAGAYAYDADTHALHPVGAASLPDLQARYALQNYSTGQAAALIALSGRLDAMVDGFGAPGYRFLGIEIGQAAQAAYVAAAARGLGVGAVLGVDNLTVNALLGLDDGDEQTMLFLFLGNERRSRAAFSAPLLPPHPHRAGPAGQPTEPEGPRP